MRQIQSALEEYRADQHAYPDSLNFGSSLQDPTGQKKYMDKLPTDSTGKVPYLYELKNSNYCLYANMENVQNGVNLNSCDKSGYNFEATTP